MVRIPLPFTDAYLLLSPRWEDLGALPRSGALLLCLLVPLTLVLWLYRFELKLVRRSAAVSLLALRLIAIIFLVFVVCLRPIVARSTTEELPGRVLVAVDRSDSMDVADPQRSPVDKLRLARVLNLGGDVSETQLNDWIYQYEHGRFGIQWVAPDEFRDERERRRQLADERRRLHDQLCRRIDGLTRTQVAQMILAPSGVGLLETLTNKHHTELVGFGREAWDVKLDQVDELFRPLSGSKEAEGKNTGPHALDFGQGTDLRLPLLRALERSGTEEGKILGVVLLSDGQHNWGPSPVAKAIELGDHQIPIYPIALGTPRAPPDIALVGIKAPSAVFKDVDTTIEARFKVSGLPSQDIVVELQRPKQPPMLERIRHDGTDQYHTVRFQVRLDQVGTQALTVTAKPVVGEIRTDNNSRPVVINVADDKARVLLIDGEARWEYHYLANALGRDRTVLTQSVVFQQPRLGKIAEEDLKKAGNPTLLLPADPDGFAAYDCIILGDVSPTQLSLPERLRLEKYVADRGGTLVILAGKHFMPLAFQETGEANPQPAPADKPEFADRGDPLLKLLPILEPRAVHPLTGFPVTLTHEGQGTPFLQMEGAPDKSLARWAALPSHFWGIVGRAKPGATSLAFLAGEEALADNKDKIDPDKRPERQQALLARQNYGFGRVLFVGLDSTWRWRFKVGDTYHHRFWGQVIRWAASDKPLVAGNDHVRFGTREPVYQQGQEVELVVRLGESEPPLRPDALAGGRLLRLNSDGKEEAVALVPLVRRAAQPRVLEGRVRDLPAGQYQIELAVPEMADKLNGPPGSDGQAGKLRAAFTVTPSDSGEMIELASNQPLLEELASKSGGKVFSAENATELVELLTHRAVTREHRTERKSWQEWWTLLVFLLLLSAEWVGRKLAGLP